jgi:hypothetical protein
VLKKIFLFFLTGSYLNQPMMINRFNAYFKLPLQKHQMVGYFFVLYFATGSLSNGSKTNHAPAQIHQQLHALEQQWFKSEFALDTAAVAALLHSDFISIAANENTSKHTELEVVYKNISAMKADSIFIDSFKIEEPFVVKQFDNTAIAIFICHTYKTNKGRHEERRTKFYDVWHNTNGVWKARSSQATMVEEIK